MQSARLTGFGLIALAVGLAANSILGPFVTGAIDYRFSDSLNSQGIGLDAVSLFFVAPLSLFAGVLVLQGKCAGFVLGLAPAIFSVYMLIQYIVGPDYNRYPGNNERFFLLHTAIFSVAGAVFFLAWNAIDVQELPKMSLKGQRITGWVLIVLALFVVLGMYLGNGFLGAMTDFNEYAADPDRVEYYEHPVMLWIVAFMDLGFAVPFAIASGVGMLHGAAWARKGMYAILGWYALVGIAVAAMAITMVVNDDAAASTPRAVAFSVVAAVSVLLAGRLFWPVLFAERKPRPRREATAGHFGKRLPS